MRNATLCLSGGGAKGAYQVGALQVLAEFYRFTRVYGVSVGALNGVFVALGRTHDLGSIWRGIREKDIHKRYGWPRVLWRIARGKRGIYDNTPLRDTLRLHLSDSRVPQNCRVGFVDLTTGRYVLALPTIANIWASATMPVVWEPVADIYVDGGVRNVTPLSDAIDAGAEEIVCILCNPQAPESAEKPKNLIDVAKRSLDIALNEIARTDLSESLRINALVEQAEKQGVTLLSPSGRPYRYVPITVIEPAESLGDTLDFSQVTIRRRLERGRADAWAVMGIEEAA